MLRDRLLQYNRSSRDPSSLLSILISSSILLTDKEVVVSSGNLGRKFAHYLPVEPQRVQGAQTHSADEV